MLELKLLISTLTNIRNLDWAKGEEFFYCCFNSCSILICFVERGIVMLNFDESLAELSNYSPPSQMSRLQRNAPKVGD